MAARLSALARRAGVAFVAALVVGACAAPGVGPTYPPVGSTPQPATGVETNAARGAVISVLSEAGLHAGDPDQPYQVQEGPWFAAAPRTVVEVTVPGDEAPKFVVLYAFASPTDAASGAADQAAYVSKGVGLAYFPSDSRFTIRVLGSTAIFFTWSPSNADPKTQAIETALDQIGTEVPVSP